MVTILELLGGLFALFVVCMLLARRCLVAPKPNELVVLSGRKYVVERPDGSVEVVGHRIVTHGRAWKFPVVEMAHRLDLTPLLEASEGVSGPLLG